MREWEDERERFLNKPSLSPLRPGYHYNDKENELVEKYGRITADSFIAAGHANESFIKETINNFKKQMAHIEDDIYKLLFASNSGKPLLSSVPEEVSQCVLTLKARGEELNDELSNKHFSYLYYMEFSEIYEKMLGLTSQYKSNEKNNQSKEFKKFKQQFQVECYKEKINRTIENVTRSIKGIPGEIKRLKNEQDTLMKDPDFKKFNYNNNLPRDNFKSSEEYWAYKEAIGKFYGIKDSINDLSKASNELKLLLQDCLEVQKNFENPNANFKKLESSTMVISAEISRLSGLEYRLLGLSNNVNYIAESFTTTDSDIRNNKSWNKLRKKAHDRYKDKLPNENMPEREQTNNQTSVQNAAQEQKIEQPEQNTTKKQQVGQQNAPKQEQQNSTPQQTTQQSQQSATKEQHIEKQSSVPQQPQQDEVKSTKETSQTIVQEVPKQEQQNSAPEQKTTQQPQQTAAKSNSQTIIEDVQYKYSTPEDQNYNIIMDESTFNQTPKVSQQEQKIQKPEKLVTEEKGSNKTNERGQYTKMDLQDLMGKFAEVHNNFYNKNTHTKEEISQKRKLNYAMKKLIDQEIENCSKNGESQQKDEELIKQMSNPVGSADIDALANNPLAVAKLFKIQASGVYEKEGQPPVRLTQKQRTAISSVLVQVSEKRLQGEEAKSNEKIDNSKNNAANKDKQTTAEKGSELGGED